jgi:hypothetical protein
MLEALHFLDATARLVLIDLRTVISGRCKGVAKDMFLMKNPLEQKYQLTMENVRFLEDLYYIPYSSKKYEVHIGPTAILRALLLSLARLTASQDAVGGARAW